MKRRDFLRGVFALGAAGLLLPERKVWALDQTMIPPKYRDTLRYWPTDEMSWDDYMADRSTPFVSHLAAADIEQTTRELWAVGDLFVPSGGGPVHLWNGLTWDRIGWADNKQLGDVMTGENSAAGRRYSQKGHSCG